jgi:hypothetical protein
VFNPAEKLLRQDYPIRTENCYSSPKLSYLLNKSEIGAVGTMKA